MPTPSPTPTATIPCGDDCPKEGIGTVEVVFMGRQCAGNPGDNFPNVYLSSVSVGPGTATETFKSTALAYYNAPTSGSPTNQSTLDALAKQFAEDWIPWRCATQFDQVWAGVAALQPTGLYEYIEWGLASKRHATRAYTSPHNYHVQELGHFDWTDDKTCDGTAPNLFFTSTPCIAYYGPPGQCNGGHLQLTRWKECLEDGRLVQKYVSTDNIT